MRKIILAIACFTILYSLSAQQKQVAITIDDLPFAYDSKLSIKEVEKATHLLLAKLKANGIKATGFVIGNGVQKRGEDKQRTALLLDWLKEGQDLGSHSYSHPSLSKVSLEEYESDFLKNEATMNLLYRRYPQAVKYFRYPYLQMGKDTVRKHGFQRFLAAQGYQIAPVSIDNEDYIFNKVYVDACLAKDTLKMTHAAQSYLRYLSDMIDYYDQLAVVVVGRPIKQILLCHANLINANYWDELARLFTSRGYSFITLNEALQDSAYQRSDTLLISGGWSHLDRWKRNDGVKSTLSYPQIDKDIMDAYEGK